MLRGVEAMNEAVEAYGRVAAVAPVVTDLVRAGCDGQTVMDPSTETRLGAKHRGCDVAWRGLSLLDPQVAGEVVGYTYDGQAYPTGFRAYWPAGLLAIIWPDQVQDFVFAATKLRGEPGMLTATDDQVALLAAVVPYAQTAKSYLQRLRDVVVPQAALLDPAIAGRTFVYSETLLTDTELRTLAELAYYDTNEFDEAAARKGHRGPQIEWRRQAKSVTGHWSGMQCFAITARPRAAGVQLIARLPNAPHSSVYITEAQARHAAHALLSDFTKRVRT